MGRDQELSITRRRPNYSRVTVNASRTRDYIRRAGKGVEGKREGGGVEDEDEGRCYGRASVCIRLIELAQINYRRM